METKNASTINTYLMFNGNAREAMAFYKGVFGGELEIMDFSQVQMDIPEESKNNVMHASLTNDRLTLMASDAMMGKVAHGSTVQLMVSCASLAEIDRFFTGTAAGGKVTMPLTEQAGGSRFGLLTDKYGFDWMFNYDPSKA